MEPHNEASLYEGGCPYMDPPVWWILYGPPPHVNRLIDTCKNINNVLQ